MLYWSLVNNLKNSYSDYVPCRGKIFLIMLSLRCSDEWSSLYWCSKSIIWSGVRTRDLSNPISCGGWIFKTVSNNLEMVVGSSASDHTSNVHSTKTVTTKWSNIFRLYDSEDTKIWDSHLVKFLKSSRISQLSKQNARKDTSTREYRLPLLVCTTPKKENS